MKILALWALLWTLLTSLVLSQTYYYDPSGSDAADGLTPATAKQTIAHLNANLPSGAAALLKAGETWAERLMPVNPDVYIGTFGTANAGRATISVTSATQCVRISGVDNVHLSDLELVGGNYGVYFENETSGFVGINLYIHDVTVNGIGNANAPNSEGKQNLLLGGVIDTCGNDCVGIRDRLHLTVTGVSCSNAVDDGLSAHDSATIAAYYCRITDCDDGIQHVNDTGQNIVHGCYIANITSRDCISLQPVSWVSSSIVARNNVLVLSADVAGIRSCARAVSAGTLYLDNNVFINLQGSVERTYCVYASGANAAVYMRNNVFRVSPTNTMGRFVGWQSGATIAEDNTNRYEYPGATEPDRWYNGTDMGFAAYSSAVGTVVNSRVSTTIALAGDPSAAPENAIPLSTSPLIGNALPLYDADDITLTRDFSGKRRRIAGVWDQGAYAVTVESPVTDPVTVTVPTTSPVFSQVLSLPAHSERVVVISQADGLDDHDRQGCRRIQVSSGSAGAIRMRLLYEGDNFSVVGSDRQGADEIAFASPGSTDATRNDRVMAIVLKSTVDLDDVAITAYN